VTADECYDRNETVPLQQGDVITAPLARLQTEPDFFPDPWRAFDSGRTQLPAPTPFSDPWVVGGWGYAMIVSHDCHLDKEFNKLVGRLRAEEQLTLSEAEERAEQDPTLDRFLTVSPVLPLDAFPTQASNIPSGDVIGLFHLPSDATTEWLDHVVDLTYRATIDRFFVEDRRFVLTEEARRRFRLTLARTETFRSSEIGFQLEEVFHKRIRDVRPDPDEPIGVEIEMWDGTFIKLIQQPAEPSDNGPARTRAPRREAT
jgi:hypothetical protein